jgi:hypothetical protein
MNEEEIKKFTATVATAGATSLSLLPLPLRSGGNFSQFSIHQLDGKTFLLPPLFLGELKR